MAALESGEGSIRWLVYTSYVTVIDILQELKGEEHRSVHQSHQVKVIES